MAGQFIEDEEKEALLVVIVEELQRLDVWAIENFEGAPSTQFNDRYRVLSTLRDHLLTHATAQIVFKGEKAAEEIREDILWLKKKREEAAKYLNNNQYLPDGWEA